MVKKTRSWCFTNFDLEFDYDALFDKGQIRYMAWAIETCPSTGKQHHQGWLYFHNQQGSFKNVGASLGGAHVETMKGSILENDAYCSKEGQLNVLGTKPPGQGARTDLDAEKERIMSGEVTADEICQENPTFYHQYGRTLNKLEELALRKKWRTWQTVGTWYTGPTGAGKSHACFTGYDPSTHYVKCLQDEWWDGYTGQEVVILNEFRGNIPFGDLMDLVDKWPKMIKRRGREPLPFLAREVRISSIMSPSECYKYAALEGSKELDEFNRRFKVVNLKKRKIGPEVV